MSNIMDKIYEVSYVLSNTYDRLNNDIYIIESEYHEDVIRLSSCYKVLKHIMVMDLNEIDFECAIDNHLLLVAFEAKQKKNVKENKRWLHLEGDELNKFLDLVSQCVKVNKKRLYDMYGEEAIKMYLEYKEMDVI